MTTDSGHAYPVAENVWNREFGTQSVDSAWCADITYVATASGWVYLAAIIDLATRMIVGWLMATHMRTELIEAARLNALSWRTPAQRWLHHSNRGAQCASDAYRTLLEAHGLVGRQQDC